MEPGDSCAGEWPAEGTLGPRPRQARRPGQGAANTKGPERPREKGRGRPGRAGDAAAGSPGGHDALVPGVNSPSLRPADGGARGRGPSPPAP